MIKYHLAATYINLFQGGGGGPLFSYIVSQFLMGAGTASRFLDFSKSVSF